MKRLVALLALSTLFLVPGGPASADDEVEIDGRLVAEGFQDAYTTYVNADGGVRVTVDFVSDSADAAAFAAEAETAAGVVWRHLAMRVSAVDVATSAQVSWLDSGLPAAVSLSRADLQERFGARAAALDEDTTSTTGDMTLMAAVAGAVGLVLLAVGAGAGFLGGFLLGRRRRRPTTAWGAGPAWPGSAVPPQPGPQQQPWGQQPWDQQQPWAQPQPQRQPADDRSYTPTAPNPPST